MSRLGRTISLVIVALLAALALVPALAQDAPLAGGISGMVYRADGITPISGAGVNLYTAGAGVFVTNVVANASGAYSFTGVAAGSYAVQAQLGGFTPEWYLDKVSFVQATSVTMTDGGTATGINFTLDEVGFITGRITAADGVTPLSANIAASPIGEGAFYYGLTNPADGTYNLEVGPGTYRVTASSDGYITEYYNNTTNYAAATGVTVTSSTTTPNINFALDLGGTISGTVFEEDGTTPINGAFIRVLSGPSSEIATSFSDVDGTYSIGGLPPGAYKLYASAVGFADEFYLNKPDYASGNAITVTAGSTTPNVNFTLGLPGMVTGKVTADDGITPLADVSVQLYRASDNSYVIGTITGADGLYSLSAANGTYRVWAYKNGYLSEYWDNQRSSSNANPVTLTAGTTVPNINFALTLSASFSGTAYRADGTTPIPNAKVRLTHAYTGSYYPTTANGSGVFSYNGLEPGPYILRGTSAADGMVYYPLQETDTAATPFTLAGGDAVTGVNLVFFAPGSISGTISAAAPPPEADSAFAQTRAFVPGSPVADVQALNFAGQFLAQRGETYDSYLSRELANREQNRGVLADPLSLIAPVLTSLALPGEGTPADWAVSSQPTADGLIHPNAVTSGTVTAYLSDPSYTYETPLATLTATINADGSFTFPTAPAGSYRIKVVSPGYITEYAQDVYTLYEAPYNRVASGATTTVNMTLDPAGTVTGFVYGPDGATPLNNRRVSWSASNYDTVSRCTGADGSYTLPDVPTNNSFVVNVDGDSDCLSGPAPYFDKSYNGGQRFFFDAGSPPMTDINFTLEEGGTISGTVRRSDGTTPIQGAYLYFYDSTYSYQGYAATNASGQYTSSALAPGQYKAYLSNGTSGGYTWASRWYDNDADFYTAMPIDVLSGTNTASINFTAESSSGGGPTGSISGRLFRPDGVTPASGNVTLYRRSGSSLDYVTSGYAGSSTGAYTVSGLAAGDYVVTAQISGYAKEYYDNATTLDDAMTITVPSGGSVANINFVANPGTMVSGTVLDGSTGQPWDFPYVAFYTSDMSFVGSARTTAYGVFEMTLPPGSYKAYGNSYPFGAYIFYGNSLTTSGAANIVVPPADLDAPSAITGLTITLPRYGEATGRVTQTDGTTPIAQRAISVAPAGAWSSYAYCNTAAGWYTNTYAYIGYDNLAYTYQTCGDDGGNFAGEYYLDSPTSSGATPVRPTSARRVVANVNFTLGPGGSISGMVYAQDGITPLANAYVYAYLKEGTSYTFINSDQSDATGAYVIDGLVSGQYVLASRLAGYVTEVFENKLSIDTGNPVTVTVPDTVTGINFTLAPEGSTATLTMTMVANGLPPKPNAAWSFPVEVTISDSAPPDAEAGSAVVYSGTVMTDTSGMFTITGLPIGNFTVRMKPANGLAMTLDVTLAAGTNAATAPSIKAGDTNGDNVVNITDFSLLAASFGKASGTDGFDIRADYNRDGVVNITDFSLLAAAFGQAGAP